MGLKKTSIIVSLVAVLALIAGAGYFTRQSWMHLLPGGVSEGGFKIVEKEGKRFKECYVCPMHPQVIKPAPGSCPICGMDLVKKLVPMDEQPKQKTQDQYRVFEREGVTYKECYVCPMHPQVIRPTQGDCPICGMDLVKEEVSVKGAEHEGMAGMGGTDKAEMKELERISLDPRERVLANVQTTPVVYKDISRDVYTVGRVAVNEDTIRKAAAWFPGRIERMNVNYIGQVVRKGERIMSVYSPELVSTQKEYLVAKKAAGRLGNSGFPEISDGTNGVVEAARERMKLWGMTDAQIDRLDETGVPDGSLGVFSRISGTVTNIAAREGGYVMEGSELYTVADLGSVWVNAEVYEYEFSKVRLGASVEVTADAFPGEAFKGRVSFIDPVVDNQSRTVRVRAVIPNPTGMLKPDMFVNARILSTPKRALTVPASAVLYTGRRDIVWVEVSPGVYEPRDVELGLHSGEEYEVLSGLMDGDVAVTQGGFLIDSEAQLRKSAGSMSMPGMDMGGEGSGKTDMGGHAGHQH